MSRTRIAMRLYEGCIGAGLRVAASVSLLTTASIIAVLVVESSLFFREVSLRQFLFDSQWTPLFVDKRYGIWPLICGTVLTSAVAMIIAIPTGLIIAVYLSEFAREGTRKVIKPILELLAGVPTIVYGYFALLFITPMLQMLFPSMGSFNALSAGVAMGIMILPTMASLSEDAMYAVPRSVRESAYALGASRLQMVCGAVLPGAVGGIVAAIILSISRAVGETMIVAIAAGQQPLLHLNPLQPVETMTAYIVQVSLGDTPHGTLEYHTLFAVAMTLFLLTLALNTISIAIRERYRRMYR